MNGRKGAYAIFLLILLGMAITGAGEGMQRKYLRTEKEFYLTQAELAWVRPGLGLEIQSVAVNGAEVSVTFRIADDQGQPLDRLGIETPGMVTTSWILARINPGDTQYTAYTARVQQSPITGQSATQAGTDSGGRYTSLGNGVYRYTFGTRLPSDFPASATHTVGVYSVRDLREIAEQLGLTQLVRTGRYIANDTYDFVPSGGEVTQVRDVVRTESCNQCHDPLALHGGARQEVRVCVLCHQPQTTDPDTGNTVDFKVMIHKIHRGEDLPSVQGGTPYQIIGFSPVPIDYSHVVFPQDVRNCTTCHQQTTQADLWKTNPTRVVCGSCHDDVDFATGENHAGGAQADDSRCSICHTSNTGLEFDLSVDGVHTIPDFSQQLKGLHVAITEITNTRPGEKPTVSFTVRDNAGNPINAAGLATLALRLAGPTTDYTWMVSEDARSATATATGYTYTFRNNAIPADAQGTYAVGAEARSTATLAGPLLGQSFTATETAFNPVFYFSVDGSAVAARRSVVDVNTRCNTCHHRLTLHGGTRLNTDYCVMCHNPATVDVPSQAAGGPVDVPPQSINLRFMIHRIHAGEELTRDFTIYRSRGVFNFNEVLFPGDRRNCAKCHVNNSHELPLPEGMANTVAPREFFSPLGPASSACLGCHDTEAAAAHAFQMTATFPSGRTAESCASCHGEGRDFAVSRVHAR
jgi:OmcA/MtrC family decaheme c-type cytochrome